LGQIEGFVFVPHALSRCIYELVTFGTSAASQNDCEYVRTNQVACDLQVEFKAFGVSWVCTGNNTLVLFWSFVVVLPSPLTAMLS